MEHYNSVNKAQVSINDYINIFHPCGIACLKKQQYPGVYGILYTLACPIVGRPKLICHQLADLFWRGRIVIGWECHSSKPGALC
jgi:hypothetical protein